jgi:hypothetical protein
VESAVEIVAVPRTAATTIAFEPAMLLAPVGTVVEVMGFPGISVAVPTVKLETVRSALESPACTVYVPVRVVPADAAVRVTVRPVSKVTTIVLRAVRFSLAVAEIFIVCWPMYVPSADDDEKEVIVGAV